MDATQDTQTFNPRCTDSDSKPSGRKSFPNLVVSTDLTKVSITSLRNLDVFIVKISYYPLVKTHF